jgi:hypothetical protein
MLHYKNQLTFNFRELILTEKIGKKNDHRWKLGVLEVKSSGVFASSGPLKPADIVMPEETRATCQWVR